MKKLLPIGLLALSFTVFAEDASAWINSRFGLGFNWGWQSGGNNLLWGLFRDGQPGGPDIYHVDVPVYPKCGCPSGYPGAYPGAYPGVQGPVAPAPGLAGPGFGGPGFGGPGGPGFGGPVGPGFGGPVAPGAPVSTGGMFSGPEHAIQAPTPPATSSGAQPVSFYRQANYGYYYPTYRGYR